MKVQSLEQYYVEELKDLYDAEKQLLRALPRMAKIARHEELRAAFEEHAEQTEEQLRRLERILRKHERGAAGGRRCKAMQGLIEEGREMMEEKPSPNIMDVGLITTAQKIEHYEIAGYGCTTAYAKLLGLRDEAELLHRTLGEEKETDQRLSKLAKSIVNVDAEHADGEFQEERLQPRSKRQTQGRAGGRTGSRGASMRGRGSRRTSSRGGSSRGGKGGRAASSSRGSGSARATQDLNEIREWVEARGGKPAKVCGTGRGADPGLLRIDFPGYSGADSLQEIPWEEWYEKFQESNLTFLYQDKTKGGRESRFFKLVCKPGGMARGR